MYVLFYAQGTVCIVAGQVNLVMFEKLGMKKLILYTQVITVIMATFIILVQEHIIALEDPISEKYFV
jgi:hypothetical protein